MVLNYEASKDYSKGSRDLSAGGAALLCPNLLRHLTTCQPAVQYWQVCSPGPKASIRLLLESLLLDELAGCAALASLQSRSHGLGKAAA